MQYTFKTTGISANEMLLAMGIKTIEKDGKKFLSYNGIETPRPPAIHLEDKLLAVFGIEIIYKD